MVPYFLKGISKPVFVAGIQKALVGMYEGEIYNDSLKWPLDPNNAKCYDYYIKFSYRIYQNQILQIPKYY